MDFPRRNTSNSILIDSEALYPRRQRSPAAQEQREEMLDLMLPSRKKDNIIDTDADLIMPKRRRTLTPAIVPS